MFLFTELYYSTEKDFRPKKELEYILAAGQDWIHLFIWFWDFIFILLFTVEENHFNFLHNEVLFSDMQH